LREFLKLVKALYNFLVLSELQLACHEILGRNTLLPAPWNMFRIQKVNVKIVFKVYFPFGF